MRKELTTEQLSAALEGVLSERCGDVDPTRLNLRFCPTVEICDGPSRSVTLRFRTYGWMSNPMGVTHGGIVSAILDSSMGILCTAFNGAITPTITLTTNFCRPVPLDADVLVLARLSFPGGTSAQLTAELRLPEEPAAPLATASGVFYTAGAKKEQH